VATREGLTAMDRAKPFCIAKLDVWKAYKQVKANRGAAGVDGQSIEDFDEDLSKNLYRIWNRMSSGSYFPPPVRRVDIPKGDSGGTRPLGIPTVSDRIAQMVVKRHLEPILEPVFHRDSYGYRPGKSAHDALVKARQRCWASDWVLDIDIKGFFDEIDWDLLMRAVRRHTDCPWVLLYLERWLRAPVSMPDGTLVDRQRGTPQGAVVSPVLANLFLHYAFDHWMQREYPSIPFERYADDAICHCATEAQALELLRALERRFAECQLRLHPQKTKIVYCKDANRPGEYPERSFDFLGYTFRSRMAVGRGRKRFVSFIPAVSDKAAKRMRQEVRKWRLHLRSDLELKEIADWVRPTLAGWVRYYGRFYPSKLREELRTIDAFIVRWVSRKYKRFRGHTLAVWDWLCSLRRRNPTLFAHWALGPAAG
jgi:group II intron reverse transcriptase/maturase